MKWRFQDSLQLAIEHRYPEQAQVLMGTFGQLCVCTPTLSLSTSNGKGVFGLSIGCPGLLHGCLDLSNGCQLGV